MAQPLLTLPEILAMLDMVKVPPKTRAAFEEHAQFVLDRRGPLTRTDDELQVEVGSGYSSASKRGHVALRLADTEHQLSIDKAKQIGRWLIEAAEAATSDALVVALFEKIGFDDPVMMGRILLDLRELRQGTRDVKQVL